MITRRHFVAATLAAGFAPRLVVAQSADGVIDLVAEKAEMQLLTSSGKTPVWRFLKEKPIAVVRAKQGEVIKFRLTSKIDQEIWLHFFGVRGPEAAMTVNCGAQDAAPTEFEFAPPDAGTFWFGPLVNASRQRDMGLYGMLIVEEKLPQDFIDVPMIFDDWMIDDAGKMKGTFGDLQAAIAEGRMGNWFTLNGSFKSQIKVERNKAARLRLLNAANVRTMNVLFKGAELYMMALDGQPVPLKPLGQEALKLAPGQRADVLMPDINAQIVVSLDLSEDQADIGFLEPAGEATPHDLPDNFALPANPLSPLGDLTTARQITITIAGGAKGGLKSAKVGNQDMDIRAMLEKGLAWAMNGIAGAGGPPLFEAKMGETLILQFDNLTAFPQPMHIHGHVWQEIERDGQPVEGQPWRDTAVVPGLSKLKLAMVADNSGFWSIQSLVAERCDAGLLGAFTVAGASP
jgi:FtsP/CotA-like multicopper oxidase with cupredoxin domain